MEQVTMEQSKKKVNFNEMNLYVRFVQYVSGNESYYLPWRIIYDNFLIFVAKGQITLKFETSDIVICENEMCIIPPFLKNRLLIEKDTYCEYYGVHFDYFYDDSESFNEDVYIAENLGLDKSELLEMPIDGRLINRKVYQLENIQFPQKILIKKSVAFKELLAKLLQRFQEKSFGHEIIVRATFYEIMYMIISEINDTVDMTENTLDLFHYMQSFTNDYEKQIDVTKLALEYGMSPRKFRSIFKKIYAATPKEYIIENKMQKAKELLASGRYNVGEVAYMIGYDDIFYFSKLFKRKMGKSPKHFLNKSE